VAKETFNYVDYRVWKLLWQWCRRRHNNRHKRWIKAKYFKSVGPRNWVFSGIVPDDKLVRLLYTNDIPIKRHIKMKAEANPYDLAFEEYFEKRQERIWRDSMQGKRILLRLWLRQQQCCPMCRHRITKTTGWNIHHIVERVKGGSDEMSNLVLLHPNCHRQHHNNCV
jgi:RNA-directed DNA polymerase